MSKFCVALSVILMPLDSVGVAIGNINVRFYMIPATVVLVAAIIRPTGKNSKWPLTLKVLAVYTLLCVGSIIWSYSPSDTAQASFGQLFLLLWLIAVFRLYREDRFSFEEFCRWLLYGCFASSAVALLQVLAAAALGTDLGVWFSQNVPWPRPHGLTSEPVWAALVASIGFFMSPLARKRSNSFALMVVFGSVLVLTFSRAALAAVAAVLLLGLARKLFFSESLAATGKSIAAVLAAPIVLIPIFFLLLEVLPSEALRRLDIVRALGVDGASADQGSLASRLGVQDLILDYWGRHPILGHGVGSLAPLAEDPLMRQIYAGGGELNTGRGSTNLLLTNLYDLGVVGLLLVVALIVSLIVGTRGVAMPQVVARAILLVALIQFMASNGFRLGIFWALMAVVIFVQHSRNSSAKELRNEKYLAH
ncbi:O-antigen ligase family protein [Arenivirga flava]|nr:O-antigen ligase family protein [Arenivirga flava]